MNPGKLLPPRKTEERHVAAELARATAGHCLRGDWDMVIVGGGITGAGILLEAARRGLRALLVEQRDFAWGTSSRSSKLVHGGLRYLKEGKLLPDARFGARAAKSAARSAGPGGSAVVSPSPITRAQTGALAVRAGSGAVRLDGGAALAPLLSRKTSSCCWRRTSPRRGLKGGMCYRRCQDRRCAAGAARAAGSDRRRRRRASITWRRRLVAAATARQGQVDVELLDAVEWRELYDQSQSGHQRHRRLGRRPAPAIRPPDPSCAHCAAAICCLPAWRLPVAQAVSLMHPRDGRPVFAFPWEGVTLVGTTDVDHGDSMQGRSGDHAD